MKSEKLFILCSIQNKSPKKNTITKSSQYKDGHYIMKSADNKTSKSHILVLKLTNELDLRTGGKVIALSNLSIYYTWRNIKSSYNNNRFKISKSTWNEEFKLPDGSYSVSDIQDYFE